MDETGYPRKPIPSDTRVLRKRLVAQIIDYFIAMILILLVSITIGLGTDGFGLSKINFVYSGLVSAPIIPVLYGFIIESIRDGRTVGKSVMGIKTVTIDGDRVYPSHTLRRNITGVFSMIPVVYILSSIVILITDKNQRLGDKIAGTVVVNNTPVSSRGDKDEEEFEFGDEWSSGNFNQSD